MDSSNARQKIIAQVVCILLSVGMWFYVINVENPIKTQTISNVPIQINNAEELEYFDLVIAPDQDFYADLKVEGTAQELREVSSEDFIVEVDINEYALKVGENKIPIEVTHAPRNISINNTDILMVEINIEKFIEKTLDIVLALELEGREGYYVAKPELAKTEVVVSGPQSLVDRVDRVEVKGREEDISNDIIKNYDLYPLDINGNVVEGVKLNNEEVEVTIDTNGGRIVPIKVITEGEVPEGSRLDIIGHEVTEVEIIGQEALLANISEIKTETINLQEISDSTAIEVKLLIPEGVNLVALDKNTIDVNIQITRIISKDFDIQVRFIGIKDNLELSNSEIIGRVTINGYEEDLAEIKEEDLILEIDLSTYTEAGEYTVEPKAYIKDLEAEISIKDVAEVTILLNNITGDNVENETGVE